VFFGQDGNEFIKAFDIQDGLGIKLLQQCGIETAIITGRNSKMVLARCKELDIKHVFLGVDNKTIALNELLKRTALAATDCAVMGDDWPDLPMMKHAGLRVCPAQGHEAVRDHAHFVTAKAGGAGAVRELCDLILKAQNRYEELLSEARN
jgi:3-deoxy-D-manno-octulosonate 8-phosphate phosphatase (KDO 8-P phosphatase)